MMFDIIIIGAGPAGATLSRPQLGRHLNVLYCVLQILL